MFAHIFFMLILYPISKSFFRIFCPSHVYLFSLTKGRVILFLSEITFLSFFASYGVYLQNIFFLIGECQFVALFFSSKTHVYLTCSENPANIDFIEFITSAKIANHLPCFEDPGETRRDLVEICNDYGSRISMFDEM